MRSTGATTVLDVAPAIAPMPAESAHASFFLWGAVAAAGEDAVVDDVAWKVAIVVSGHRRS